MALSPNAPDYVSEVRGVINDLRQNYLTKQQLFQQDQQAKANLAFNYAQLQSQKENQAVQADIERQRLAASELANASQFETLKYNQQRQAAADDLAQRRYDLDAQKEINDVVLKRKELERDQSAGVLENEFRIAYEGDDKKKISEVMDKISNANLKSEQRTALYNNVMVGLQRKRQLEDVENNRNAVAPVGTLMTKLRSLDPTQYTPEEYKLQVRGIQDEFNTLKVTDNNLLGKFSSAVEDAMTLKQKERDSYVGRAIDEFTRSAEWKKLDPEDQRTYDALKAKGELSYQRLHGLTVDANTKKSIAILQQQDARNIALLEDLKKQYPNATYRDLSQNLPNLTPSNTLIDPETGELSKNFAAIQKDFDDKYNRGSFVFGVGYNPITGATAGMIPPTPPTPGATPIPTKSRSDFSVTQGKTATIPAAPEAQAQPVAPQPTATAQTPPATPATAPVAKQPKLDLKPETVAQIQTLWKSGYTGNFGKYPIKDLVARLKMQGVVFEEPQTQVAKPQKR